MTFLNMIKDPRQTLLCGPARWLGYVLSFLAHQRGVSSFQLALVFPILLIAVLGAMDMGRILLAQSTLIHAANEAVRFAMVRSASSEQAASEADIIELIRGRMTGLDVDRAVIDVNWIPENQPGAYVTVDVDYPYDLSSIGIGSLNLTGSSGTFVER